MARESRRSLRHQLLVLVLALVSAAWLTATVASYRDARHEVAEILDAHLAQTASLVIAQWDGAASAMEAEHAPVLHRYGRQVMFQIWDDRAVLRLHSLNAPNTPLSPVTDGFSDASIDGVRWRVFSVWSEPRRIRVQVGEQFEERDELATAVARNVGLPLALMLPALGILIWAAIGRTTRPLTRVSQQLTSRAADSLFPLDVARAPSEVDTLVTSLNQLFERVRGAIERERRFTADAAHELRTPLAGIRAQAQVALAATEDAERSGALENVVAGCDRATHTVEQMLTLARLSADDAPIKRTACDLRAILKTTIIELAPDALKKHIDVELDTCPDVFVQGDPGLLGILFRNVIDNAVRYSPPRTTVHVAVARTAIAAAVTVVDQGPGIAPAERGNVGRRFYRVLGTSAPGSGLGLSIVRQIVDLHHGRLDLDVPQSGRGLQVTISLPL